MRSNAAPAIFTGFLLTVFAMTPTAGRAASGEPAAKAPVSSVVAPRC